MKIRVPQAVIASEIAALSGSILSPSNSVTGTQAGIRIVAEEGGRITLSAHNQRDYAEFVVEAEVVEPGEVLVAADRVFPQLIASLSGRNIEIGYSHGGNSTLSLKSDSAEYSVPCLIAGDWQDFPETGGDIRTATVSRDEFFLAVQRAGKAASSNETQRPILNGVLLSFGDSGKLMVAATDAYRISVRTIDADGDAAGTGFVVHSRGLDTLLKMAKLLKDCERMTLSFDPGRRLSVEVPGRFRFSTAVLGDESKFPKISNVIPRAISLDVLVDKREFVAASKRVSLFVGDERSNPIKLRVEDTGIMELSCEQSASTVGTGKECVEASEVLLFEQDSDYVIGMNSRLLADGVSLIDGDTLRFRATSMSGNQVLVISEPGEELESISNFYLVIAFRLQ